MTSGKLENRTEDIVVEALGHILTTSEASRQALQDFLLTCGADIGEINRIVTQKPVLGVGRPDLIGYDEKRKFRLFVEVKFGAGLTGNQPVAYLGKLGENRPSALLFVAPPNRLNAIWEELRSRVSKAEDLDLGREHKKPEIMWADVGEDRKLILTSWRFLLDNLAAQASSAVAHTVNDLHQLQSMVELRGFDSALPLSTDFPRSLSHLYALVDDTVEHLIEKGLAEIPPGAYRPTVHRTYSVRYFTFCEEKSSSSFGIYFRNWRTYHHSPLQFTVHNHLAKNGVAECVAKRLLAAPFHGWQSKRHIYIPIHLQGGDYQTVLNSIVEQIERIAALIRGNPSP